MLTLVLAMCSANKPFHAFWSTEILPVPRCNHGSDRLAAIRFKNLYVIGVGVGNDLDRVAINLDQACDLHPVAHFHADQVRATGAVDLDAGSFDDCTDDGMWSSLLL